MKNLILHCCIIASCSMTAQAQEAIVGKQLHDDFCVSCHTDAVYTRAHRIVNSYPELVERVRQCELANNLTWFDEEIEAVIGYINSAYYQFETE